MKSIVLISDKRVSSIPTLENFDDFIDLTQVQSHLKFDLDCKSVQSHSPSTFFARRRVGEMLSRAQSLLPNGVFLQIKECYRPLWVQKKFWSNYTAYLKIQNPDWTRDQISDEASKYLAPIHVAPHATGGAVDLILVDDKNQALDMGTDFNASPFKTNEKTYTNSEDISKIAKKNRETLSQVMSEAGFVNYPTEWWHWSYGDKYWAFQKNMPASIFSHKKVEFSVRQANAEDVLAIARVHVASWKTTYKGIIHQSFLDSLTIEKRLPGLQKTIENPETDLLVVCENETGHVVGFVVVGRNREKNVDADGEMHAIYLAEEFQGFGAGKLLFEAGKNVLAQKSFKKMMVSVFQENRSTCAFYENRGGTLIGSDSYVLEGIRYLTSTYLWDL